MKKLLSIALVLVLSTVLLSPTVLAANLVTKPNLETGENVAGLNVRDDPSIGTELINGGGYNGSNALRVFDRKSVDNSPIFFAPDVVKGKAYDFSVWFKLEADPGENGVLVHICYAVQSVEAHFVPLPTGTATDNAYLVTGTDWVKLEVKNFMIEAGATDSGNDFGMFLTTWSGPVSYLISDVTVVESGSPVVENGSPKTADSAAIVASVALFLISTSGLCGFSVLKKAKV